MGVDSTKITALVVVDSISKYNGDYSDKVYCQRRVLKIWEGRKIK